MSISQLPDDRRGLFCISGGDNPNRPLDVVFIHGLGGDAFTSWMADPDRIETFWPNWLADDWPRAGIWTLGYAADVSGWKAQSMPLADRCVQVLDLLVNEGLGQRSLVFVAHSMGGIVAKQVLRHADSYGVARWECIAQQTRGIAFIAVPHSGANLASFAEFAAAFLRTNEQVKELASHDAHLRELHNWFRGFYTHHGLTCRTWCERREVRPEIPWLGLKLPKGTVVVDETSAEPNLSGEVAVPLDEDHISICKPPARTDQLYKSLLRWLDDFDNPLCLLVVEKEKEIRVADAPDNWRTLPWTLPNLAPHETKIGMLHAGEWKRVHKSVEGMYREIREVHRHMDRCCVSGRLEYKSHAAERFACCVDKVIEFSDEIESLTPDVRGAKCLQVVAMLKYCIPAIKRSLLFPPQSKEFEDGAALVERICYWLLGTLTRADLVLEAYFGNLGPR